MTRTQRNVLIAVSVAFFWLGYSFATTGQQPRTECYERMTWQKMERTWHSHGEWRCFDN